MFQQTPITQDQPAIRHEETVVSLPTQRRAADSIPRRYVGLADRRLAETLASEDTAVEVGLSPFKRLSCPLHRRWIHQCIASPSHVSPVTGHRWCRDCQSSVTVAVDELAGKVALTCPRCRRAPQVMATRQILRACQASLAVATGAPGQSRCA